MYETTARSGWNVSSPGTLDHPMLCAEQFIQAYDTLYPAKSHELQSS
jgi:hypothetical protein